MMGRRWAAILPLAAALSACATHVPRPGSPGWIQSETSVLLHGHALKLHLSNPIAPADGPLLVYATGDAGWFWKDRELFDRITAFGYPAVGFSSREYLRNLGRGIDVIRSGAVAADYAAVIQTALQALGLWPGTRVVLVGKSRGAGLAIAAATETSMRGRLQGVVAVGLTREEEYVHSRFWRRSQKTEMLDTYAALADLPRLPVAVIQSTHDDYVPAAQARELMGGDTADRHLKSVESRDHNFGGARDILYETVQRELQWIVDR
jgi:dienelactone hydrolase